MSKRKRYYVGCSRWAGKRDIFLAAETPTEESHGSRYVCAIGPFRTKRGAQFMATYGRGNPHCQDVADAERLAQHYA